MKLNKQTLLVILLVIIVSLPAISPLLQKGFFQTDDGEWMIIRFSAFHQAVKDGELPVRLLGRLNQEYGYPVANFLYPGFMYLAEPFHILGFGFVDSVKIILIFSIILSGVFAYFWLHTFFDRFSSIVGSLFYLYTPYHLYDVYKRGSVGEVLALAIVPFILWQIERKSIVWASVGIGLLILSHNTLAVLFFGVIVGYMILSYLISQSANKRLLLLNSLFFILLGLGLAAFFWIPAVFELQYTVFSRTVVSNWKEYFATISLMGYSTFFVLLVVAVQFISKHLVIRKHRLTVMLFAFCLLAIFFSIPVSSQLWNILPVSFIQFPFRLLSIVIVCIAFLAACSISVMKGGKRYFLAVVFVLLLFVSAFPFIRTAEKFDKGEDYYATNMATTTVLDEYMPVWVTEKPLDRPEKKVEIVKGGGAIQNILYNNKKVAFNADIKEEALVRFNIIYWPGWKAWVDDKESPISYNNEKGLMQVVVPRGKHSIQLEFGETPLRLLSNLISLSSFFVLVLLFVLKSQISKRKSQKYNSK